MKSPQKKCQARLNALVTLLNDLAFHDGTTLARKLNVSRTAIWKIVQKLQDFGVPIQALKGKGYALISPLFLLEEKKIRAHLHPKDLILEIFESIDSTNTYLQRFFDSKEPRVCLAETQTQGKGRFQRHWQSPFAQNIYLSLLYPFHKDISALAGLSLVIALALVRALEKTLGLKNTFSIKWPNDILYQNKKLAGVLIELQAESHGHCNAIIGLGINVAMNTPENSWASLYDITHRIEDRNILCAQLINTLIPTLLEFEQEGLTPFLKEWESRDTLYGKEVTLTANEHLIKGTVLGITAQGHLRVRLKNGDEKSFSFGEASFHGT